MKCIICKHGETTLGTTTVTLERGETTLVFKHVPAHICLNCGEAYLDDATTERLLTIAENAMKSGVQLEVRDFIAA